MSAVEDSLNAAVISAFGESVTVYAGSVSFAVTGVLMESASELPASHAGKPQPELRVRTSDLAAQPVCVGQNSCVVAREARYTVVSRDDDLHGMTRLSLRRERS